MAYHLSIFSENKTGHLEHILKIISDSQINIRGLSVASGGEFGIIRILVSDPETALIKLKEQKVTVSKRSILAAFIDDQVGALHHFVNILSAHHINIEDCYGVVIEDKNRAVIVIETDQYDAAEQVLTEHHIAPLSDQEIYGI